MEENMLSPVQDPKLDGSGLESANNGKVKDVAKRVLKRTGSSVRSMKHVFSGRASRTRRDADMAVESDSSFDGSIPSPVYGEVSPRDTKGMVDEDEDDYMEEFVNSLQGDNETPIDNNHESPLVPNKSALETNHHVNITNSTPFNVDENNTHTHTQILDMSKPL
ncbi:hypothetical protein Hanom_Chr05g00404621 [Helianthus anomalus]